MYVIEYIIIFCFAQTLTAYKIVCYWHATKSFQPGEYSFGIREVRRALPRCTHLIVGFIDISPTDYTLIRPSALHYRLFMGASSLKGPDLKIYLGIGCWVTTPYQCNQRKYQIMLTDDALTRRFITDASTLGKDLGFDGVDLSWPFPSDYMIYRYESDVYSREHFGRHQELLTTTAEHRVGTDSIPPAALPTEGTGMLSSPPPLHLFNLVPPPPHLVGLQFSQATNVNFPHPATTNALLVNNRHLFVQLLQLLHDQLAVNGMELTMSVLPQTNVDDYSVTEIEPLLKTVHLMTFDYITPETSPFAGGYTAPLRPSVTGHGGIDNVHDTVKSWINRGLPANKIVIGIPTFARTWTVVPALCPKCPYLHDFAHGPGRSGLITRIPGFLSYYEVCLPHAPTETVPFQLFSRSQSEINIDSEFKRGAYRRGVTTAGIVIWAYYEDPLIIHHKMEYVREHNLGGAAVYELSTDDHLECCANSSVLSNVSSFYHHVA